MDILSQLLEAEIERRVLAAAPPTTWGVWIPGQGWLFRPGGIAPGDAFATESKALAVTAWELLGQSGYVLQIDQSMVELQDKFLEAEKEQQKIDAEAIQKRKLLNRLKRWLISLKSH